MAVTFVKRSSLPVTVKGKLGTLSVVISNNGQMALSSLATKFFENTVTVVPTKVKDSKTGVESTVDKNHNKCVIGFEKGKVYLFRKDAPIIAKAKTPESEMFDLRYDAEGKVASLSVTNILRDAATFGDHIYNFKDSGNQTFACTQDDKNACLVFELPKGALTPKPVTPRKKKEVAPATRAEVGSIEGKPADKNGTPVAEPELELA